MDAGLQGIEAALAAISEPDLNALVDATRTVPQIAPGFLAWVEAACDWELNGRLGLSGPLPPPESAIPPEEGAASIDVAITLRGMFSETSIAVRVLFDAVVLLLVRRDKIARGEAHLPR